MIVVVLVVAVVIVVVLVAAVIVVVGVVVTPVVVAVRAAVFLRGERRCRELQRRGSGHAEYMGGMTVVALLMMIVIPLKMAIPVMMVMMTVIMLVMVMMTVIMLVVVMRMVNLAAARDVRCNWRDQPLPSTFEVA